MTVDAQIIDDTLKGVTLGDPDGQPVFVEYLDSLVPTYVDPRIDLIPKTRKGDNVKTFKRLNHHVPFAMRGEFRPEQWPKNYREKVKGSLRVSTDGFVLCSGYSKRTESLCANKAVNRTLFCRNHGGALHPADKKLSGLTLAPMPQDRIENLDRVQKFMQGFLSVEELDDDEITGSFVRTSAGVPVKSRVLGKTFEQRLAKELHARLNRYLMSKTPRALEVLYEILDSELVEPADRLKAIQMLTDRTMGKPADVLIHTQGEDKPYESIIARVEGGSREEYRKNIASTRVAGEPTDGRSGIHSDGGSNRLAEILNAEEVDPDDICDSEETDGLGDNGSSGLSHDDGQEFSYEGSGDGERDTELRNGNFDGDESARAIQYDQSALSAAEQKRKETIEARARIKKARARRFAKRAVGGITSQGDAGFLLEFRVIADPKSPMIGKYRMKMHGPDKITPALLERVRVNNSRDLVDALGQVRAVGLGFDAVDQA